MCIPGVVISVLDVMFDIASVVFSKMDFMVVFLVVVAIIAYVGFSFGY
jgi:hypothetical protein